MLAQAGHNVRIQLLTCGSVIGCRQFDSHGQGRSARLVPADNDCWRPGRRMRGTSDSPADDHSRGHSVYGMPGGLGAGPQGGPLDTAGRGIVPPCLAAYRAWAVAAGLDIVAVSPGIVAVSPGRGPGGRLRGSAG